MTRRKSLCSLALLALAAVSAQAQISYTGGVYSQNFNTLAGTTNNTTGNAWTDNSTLPGWYATKTTFVVTDATLGGGASSFDATSGTGKDNNVGLFSFGTAASTDRALGSRATSNFPGNLNIFYGVRLVNNTSQTLTKFTVMYTGEQWYASTQSTTHTLQVDYQLGATSISTGTWTAATGGTFTAPISTGTTARALDGNAAANRLGKAVMVTGVSWAPGQELWVRFRDDNESGNEQGLSVDDFSFIAEDESGLFFNGSTSYGTMGFGTASATAFGASSFTLECRFLRTGAGATASTGTGGVTAVPLVAKGVGEAENSNVDANYFLGIDANGKLVADFEQKNATNNGTAYAAGQNFPVTGSTTLQNNVWYHVAATYNTTTATWKLYVNGVEETGVTMPITPFVGVVPRDDSIQGLGIGTTLNSSGARAGFFQGILDEVRIWNVVRTEAQIASNKDAEIVSGQAGMLARFGFDEGTGTTVAGTKADGSATTSGTLTNTTWVNARAFAPNAAPTVAITAPADGYSVMAPTTVSITATASDSDGTISKVEFYQGATKIGEDTSTPYQYDWSRTNADTGTYSLTAVAFDNAGGSTTSGAVSITITPNSNQPPVITASAPAANATGIGASTTLNVSLDDPESDAMTVTFYGRKTTPATAGADFGFIAIPDTQFYSQNTGGGLYANFTAQTQWIVDNRNTRNIAFVSHMGDIVQNGDNGGNPAEWVRASDAMATLENQASTLRAYGIPWGGSTGNHDIGTGGGTGSTTFYNQYFGSSRYEGRNYYGGHYGTDNINHYELFSASGLDFIILHFGYQAGAVSSYQAVLDWADDVLKAYPNRRAIVTSHWIVNTGNPATFSTQGQAIYDNLKDNPNLFLMLCGHVNGEGRRVDVFEGRTVYSVLQDYQDIANGGNGFLRIFTFSPANNQINVESYSPTLARAVQASDSVPSWTAAYSLSYNMQTSLTDWIPLGTQTVNAGGTSASLNWTGLEAGSNYEWYASVTDSINTASTTARRFSTTANAAPTVAISSPANNATIALPAAVNLAATAGDADGSIARVEFYRGDVKLGGDTTAPYELTWSAAAGSHAFTAVAVDNAGMAALSSVVNVTVVNPSNMPPAVTLNAPADGATFEAGSIDLTATASDTDGTITKVEFFNGATKLGEDTSSPYAFTWSSVAAGSYSLTAVATDNGGASTASSAASITVVPAGSFISSYTQSFDVLGASGTAPPAGWTVWNGPGTSNTLWTAATGIIGGPAATSGSVGQMTVSSSALTASNAPTANANNGYNAGAPGNTANRMLGSAPTSVGGMAFQLELTNASGSAISNVDIGYDIQRFTAPATVNDLPGYWLFYSVDNGATWTNVSALNPVISGGTINVPNTTGVTNVPTTTVNLASPWAVGGTLRLRWVDDNAAATSPDQIHGLDNVSITLPQPAPTVALTSPANSASFALPGPVNLVAAAADANGSVTKVEFFAGATKLGEDTSSPYELAWSGMVSGSYTLTAKATDNEGASTTSAPLSVTVTNPGNMAPSVAISSPSNNALVPASSLAITAAASDADGIVSKVEFFRGTTKLGEDSTAPFTFTWTGVPVGTHSLTAVATDNDGGASTSVAVSITATAFTDITSIARGAAWKYLDDGTNQGTAWKEAAFDDSGWASAPAELGYGDSPVSILRQGPDGQTSTTKFITYYFRRTFTIADAGQVLSLMMNLERDDGAVIYINGVEVARSNMLAGPVDYLTQSEAIVSNADETTYFPIPLPTSALVSGTNVIAVSIHQRDNTSSDLSFDLDLITTIAGGNALPVVQITAPVDGTSFFPGATIPITATAEDSDGTIAKVEFFQGSTKLGEDTSAPYEFTWNNVTAGSYALTAVATDDLGSTGASPATNVTVTPGPSGTLTRGPYLNQANQNSIVIRWRSSQSVAGRVRYGTSPDSLTQTADEPSAKTDHEVKLTGLTSYTRYYYSVGSASDTLAGGDTEHTFRTSPTPGTAKDTRIWVVGDCGRASQFQRDVRDAYYAWTGPRTPDLCLMLGDNAYNSGTDAEYQAGFYNIYPTYFRKMPLWSCMGNHDANNGSTSTTANFPYFDMFTFPMNGECGGVASGTEHYHSFDYGNIHFINIDSQTSSNSATGPMATWLQNDLASTTKTWIIAFFHHPPYSKGSHDSDTEGQMVAMRQNFGPILEAGGVDLVLVGHSHAYERSVLLDGHYGVSSTLTNAMKKNAGSGRPSGSGAYIKPLTGPRDHFGTVYTVTGSAGEISGGSLNHPVMYVSYNTGGTFNIDINGTRLDATYVQKGATTGTFTTPDSFTILKQGAADSDGDGLTDEFETANGLNRNSASDATTDSDGDGATNLVEFAFGTNPGTGDNSTLEVSGGTITKRGAPVVTVSNIENGVDFRAAFCRRKDQSAAGLTYTVQFSADLLTWQSSTVTPTVVADDGTYEVVTVRYPFFINGQKARFFRVSVNAN